MDWTKRQRDMVISCTNKRVRAEQARRRRGEEHHADVAEQSEQEDISKR